MPAEPPAIPLPTVSVVIPVYRSADLLPTLVERLEPVLRAHTSKFEVIMVNDGSPDQSWEVIYGLAETKGWVRGIDLMRNYGQHNALLCGIQAAQYEVIVTMDDDLQHPPEEIPKLLAKLADGYDVIYGPPLEEQHGLWRDLTSQLFKLALRGALSVDMARQVSAFRAIRTQVRQAFANYQSPQVSVDVLLTWGTTRFAAVPVRHEPRHIGQSNYTFRKLAIHAINMLLGYSSLPLQLASWIGFAFTVFGVGVLAYVIGRYLVEGGSASGFPFLASTIAIFAGVQLFVIGILGEYLARVYDRTMNKPIYVISSQVGNDRPPGQAKNQHLVQEDQTHG